jgi:hypothetical protein
MNKYLRRVLCFFLIGGFCLGIAGRSGLVTWENAPPLPAKTAIEKTISINDENVPIEIVLAGDNSGLIGWIIAGVVALIGLIFAGCHDSEKTISE